jgi:hypothetical protein
MGNYCGKCGTPLPLESDSDNCWRHGGPPLTPESQIKCPFCREPILAEARKCKHCGEYLGRRSVEPPPAAIPASQPPITQRSSKPPQGLVNTIKRHPIWALIVVFLMIVIVVNGFRDAMTTTSTSSDSQSPTTPTTATTPAAPRVTVQPTQMDRWKYASELDQHMIESGIESSTRASGPDFTTLRITYALAGRVMANELGNKIDFDKLKQLGFKKVILTNGFQGSAGQSFEWPVF